MAPTTLCKSISVWPYHHRIFNPQLLCLAPKLTSAWFYHSHVNFDGCELFLAKWVNSRISQRYVLKISAQLTRTSRNRTTWREIHWRQISSYPWSGWKRRIWSPLHEVKDETTEETKKEHESSEVFALHGVLEDTQALEESQNGNSDLLWMCLVTS